MFVAASRAFLDLTFNFSWSCQFSIIQLTVSSIFPFEWMFPSEEEATNSRLYKSARITGIPQNKALYLLADGMVPNNKAKSAVEKYLANL